MSAITHVSTTALPIGFDDLSALQTEQEIKVALAQLEGVKAAMEAADMFREASVKFSRLEAYALVRAVEVTGGTECIKGKWRKLAADWLASLSDHEREQYINQCSDGMTIDNIYRRYVAEPERRAMLGDAVEKAKKAAKKELLQNESVNVSSIVNKYRSGFPRSMTHEITDGVRDAVRKSGGVGIGDNDGTYIDPDKESQYVADAIRTRIESLSRDVDSIADLASRSTSKPVFCIRGDGSSLTVREVTYIILSGVGCADVSFQSSRAKKACLSLIRQIVGDA